ncbi:calcium-binding protein [Microvirga sp. BSC39]|uniref:M10 family metallopeptidase C-terminal domain-containing protein n=1 Tax=Microvirga sp. BSC39 TaxID=1549810 RepID=UPI0004E89D1A|nr:calcium-binding protein [Microvirga sp. BSC39]KFG68063.1 hypothetical protein JH26_19320 [Microvirga sp. BSC39]
MPTTVDTWNLDGDYIRIDDGAGPEYLDWRNNAEVISGYGIVNLSVGVVLGDPQHDRLGFVQGNGITATDGLNSGSRITIDGFVAVVAPRSTGYSFGLLFPDPEDPGEYRSAPPAIVQKFIRALTYQNTSEALPDDFQKLIGFHILNDGDGTTGHEPIQEYVTVTKWLRDHFVPTDRGGNWSTGGKNLPPEITGIPAAKTIADGGRPFSSVSITDPNNDKLTVTIKISDPKKGSFLASSLSGGTYDPETGIYRVTGTPAQVQDAVRKLVFTQGSGLDGSRSSQESVSFKILVSDPVFVDAATMEASFRPNKADNIKGKASSEKLYGHGGKDKIDGKGGNDKIWGGSGNDQLTGGTGKDAFVFDNKANARTNKDKIVDFSVSDDSIWLDNAFFSALGPKGTESKPALLKSSYFVTGSKAKDKNDFIIYDKAKGKLFYDADGSGKGKQVEIATLSKDLQMTYKDFFVI